MSDAAELPPLDAIIIGAGFAGMAAADALVAAGRRVVVLEARDRPGGRALTDYSLGEGIPLELGAQMIHGRTVVTHNWLDRAGLSARHYPTARRSRIVLGRRFARYPWLFLPFHPVIGTRAAWASLYGLPRAMLAFRGPDVSLEEFLDARSVAPASRPIVTLLHAHVYATNADLIGVRGQADEDRLLTEAHGFHNFLVRQGYTALVQRTAARLGDRVILNAPVREVHYGPKGVVVRVVGEDGVPDQEYRARAAIVTVPLSLLQAEAILFDPPLPPAKQAAIGRLGFGHAYAVHLKLRDGRFRRRLGDFGMAYGGGASSFYRPRVGLAESIEFLTAFTIGREAERRSRLSDAALVQATVDEWNALLPEAMALPGVYGAVVHRWSHDPWTRGAYSFLPPGSRLTDRAVLAGPVDARLFFAGEATAVDGHAATVAGAIATGTRAAQEVLGAEPPRRSSEG